MTIASASLMTRIANWSCASSGEVYTALHEAAARSALEDFAAYRQGKYDVIVQLWEKDWTELIGCMNLSIPSRKIVYATNAIENLNWEIRRVTKTKGAWVSDRALLIQLFLSLDRKKIRLEQKSPRMG